MIKSLRVENMEIQRPSDPVEVVGETGKKSDSACVFESIRSVNQEIKNAMVEEMKHRGLTDDDIRHVFHIDNG